MNRQTWRRASVCALALSCLAAPVAATPPTSDDLVRRAVDLTPDAAGHLEAARAARLSADAVGWLPRPTVALRTEWMPSEQRHLLVASQMWRWADQRAAERAPLAAGERSARLTRLAARLDAASGLRRLLIELQGARIAADAARAHAARLDALAARITAGVTGAMTTAGELAMLRSEQAMAAARIAEAESMARGAAAMVEALVGAPLPEPPLDPADPLLADLTPAALDKPLPAPSTADAHPAIAAMRADADAMRADARMADLERRPEPMLEAGLGAQVMDSPHSGASTDLMAMLELSVPLPTQAARFDAGRDAALARARAMELAADAEARMRRARLAEVTARLRDAAARLDDQSRSLLPAATAAWQSRVTDASRGVFDMAGSMAALDRLAAAERDQVMLRAEAWRLTVELDDLSGGAWAQAHGWYTPATDEVAP
jgi:outer membrane protein TolC